MAQGSVGSTFSRMLAVLCLCGLALVGQLPSGRGFVAGLSAPSSAGELAQHPSLRHPTTAQAHAPYTDSAAATNTGSATWATGMFGVTVLALSYAVRRHRTTRRSDEKRARVVVGGPSARGPIARKAVLTTMLDEDLEEDVASIDTTLVNKKSVLVMGSTGTLGRQIVRQLLNAGYTVRCMIRNKADRPFSFLVDWGAAVTEGSLTRYESLPSALIGIHTVIDCSCTRPEETAFDVDWEGKKRFIQCAEKMNVQRYIFMSIKDCDKYPNVPLMRIKYCTEQLLAKTNMRYTILRHAGFMQPLIGQYATNVLDDQKVWGDDGASPGIAYIDSQDCARMICAAMTKERCVGQTITISGPKVWSTTELIKLCEELSGREADVSVVSNTLLQVTEFAAGFFQWSIDIAERLRFVEVNTQGTKGGTMSEESYKLLGMAPENSRQLEAYISEYYRRVFKKLTKGKYEPEPGEVEREKEDDARKLANALTVSADSLPRGQPAQQDVTIVFQRTMSDRLQKMFEDNKLAEMESDKNAWVGLTVTAELVNGRAAMFGFSLGLFTEWATDVSVSKQIDELLAIFSTPGS